MVKFHDVSAMFVQVKALLWCSMCGEFKSPLGHHLVELVDLPVLQSSVHARDLGFFCGSVLSEGLPERLSGRAAVRALPLKALRDVLHRLLALAGLTTVGVDGPSAGICRTARPPA